VTFQSWQDIIEGPRSRPLQGPPSSPDFYRKKSEIAKILNFYNLIHEHTSAEVGIADIKLVLKPIEETPPSVFLMNPAMAYSLWRQSFKVCIIINITIMPLLLLLLSLSYYHIIIIIIIIIIIMQLLVFYYDFIIILHFY
jgi:hypothetical protein